MRVVRNRSRVDTLRRRRSRRQNLLGSKFSNTQKQVVPVLEAPIGSLVGSGDVSKRLKNVSQQDKIRGQKMMMIF
jgi:hypothetical protein